MKLRHIVFILLALLPAKLFSQNISIDSISSYFHTQTYLFPQEKVYAQTDRASYLVGDTIYFSAYLVNSKNHIADSKSNFIYAELLNSINDVVKRVKIRRDDAAFSGHIDIGQEILSGQYQLRFYTTNMTNVDEAYFFKKTIRIDNYISLRFKNSINFKFDDTKDEVKMDMTLFDNLTSKAQKIDKFYIYDNKETKKFVRLGDGETIYLKIKPSEIVNNCILIEYQTAGFTQKEFVHIPHRDDDFTVSFFPEGGNFLQETTNRVAFKAINSSGIGEDITGYIISSVGDTLSQFSSLHLGMGMFNLSATKDQQYALCRNSYGKEKRFELPLIDNDNLVSLQTTLRGGNLLVGINKPLSHSLSDRLYLVLHCRGEVLYSKIWNNQHASIAVKQSLLPTGVIHAMLLDKNFHPISERLVFNKNNLDQAKTTFTTSKKRYKSKEQVNGSILVTDKASQPLTGNFSVSVVEQSSAEASVNILSTLLLTSDLKGYIESPTDYFNSDLKNRHSLDLLMMTQGWRRYNVTKILKHEYEEPLHSIEVAQSISGRIDNISGKRKASDYPVLLLAVDGAQTTTTFTDDKGDFVFSNLFFSDSTKFIVQGTNARGRDRVRIKMDSTLFASKGTLLPFLKRETKSVNILDSKLTNKKETINKLLATMHTYQLDGVVVRGNQKAKIKKNEYWASSEYFSTKTTSEDIKRMHPVRLTDIIMRTAGVTIITRSDIQYTSLSKSLGGGGVKALILVDGMEMDYMQLNSIPPSTVESIEVLKDPLSFVLGPKGINGAIIITSKIGGSHPTPKSEGLALISPLGYQITKEFYSPKYDMNEQLKRKNSDERTTIYWNPNLKLTTKGESSFDFYTSDMQEDYIVIIEGITTNGDIIHKVESIKID